MHVELLRQFRQRLLPLHGGQRLVIISLILMVAVAHFWLAGRLIAGKPSIRP